ncbi:unnamed protein product [Linum trigynum]|uniref:Uncharacterized protein n=1 Tax=Linum trigynum TaxID=586398 RepID=A0AAV2CKE8_9ROSI
MLTRRIITKCIPIPHPAAAPPFAYLARFPACWRVPAVKSRRRSQRRLPAVSRARTQEDSSPTPGPVQAFVHNSIQNIFPFILCASVTVTPANAFAVATAALFILLAGACAPLIFNTLTWRDELSAGWWPMRRCHNNETSLADVLPRPESNRSASWKGDWWRFNIEDFMPTWGDAPTAEEFWYCVVFLLALGVLRRLYIIVRELGSKGEGKKVS